MSYIYARGYGRSLNDDSYEVRIISTASGSDTNKEFALDPVGFTLSYESENDALLLPGIVHSRCEVNTIWDSDEFTTLESLITALGASQDGDYLLEIIQDSTSIWVGNILVEEFSVAEDSAQRAVRFVASDGISLLRNVDYNNDGTAYTGYQTIKGILQNIQEKWVLWDYMDEQYSLTTPRFYVVDDVYSEDDYLMALLPHPAGSEYKTFERSRVHTNPWSRLNDAGDTEYINCYDLLVSLCLTYQMRLYSYGTAWYMLPCALADENPTGYTFQYGGGSATATPINQWSYQISGSDTRQKGAEWVRTFTPQTKEISLTRDPNEGSTVLSGVNVANNTAVTGADVQYDGIDTEDEETRYLVIGQLEVANSAITIDENEDLGRLVLRFEIKWAPDGVAEYYTNTLVTMYDGEIAVAQMLDGVNVNYAPIFATSQGYSASAGYYHVGANIDDHFYTPSVAGSRIVNFAFAIPPPQTAKTGLQITPNVQAYNTTAQASATLQNALTLNFHQLYVQKYSSEGPENLSKFDFVARSTAGQNKQHLGTTYIGALGRSMGRIEVQTSVGVYGTSDNWVTQASSDARPINELCVEEVLAGHTRARNLERGSIVFRGTATPPKPFSRFYDNDSGNYYTAINWQLQATPCEVDVTLRKIGRNAIGLTTEYANTGRLPDVPPTDVLQGEVKPEPQIMYGYNNQARTNFGGDWSAVIGAGETKEMYFTVANDGQGRYIDSQGNTPPVGSVIKRKTYVNTKGLQERTDSGWTSPAALQPADNDDLAACIVLMQNYMNKVGDHGSYTFMVTYDEVSTNALLDDYSGATAAYGLRKLRNAYSGSAIQVRRFDSTQTTIGFTAQGDLDTTALETFANGSDVWVVTWYDQSGDSRHVTQTATASQPKICESGTTITLNGKPAIKFDGSNDSLAAVAFNANANTNELIVAWVGSVTNLAAGNNMVSHWASTTANQVFQVQLVGSTDKLRWAHRYSNGSLAVVDSASAITSGDQYIIVGHTKQNKHEAYYEGVKATGTAQNAAPNDASTSFRIGARSDNQAGPHQGLTQEVVVWSRSTAADDPDSISDSINDYYTSY